MFTRKEDALAYFDELRSLSQKDPAVVDYYKGWEDDLNALARPKKTRVPDCDDFAAYQKEIWDSNVGRCA